MCIDEKVLSIEQYTIGLCLVNGISSELMEIIVKRVVEEFYTDGYITMANVLNIINRYAISAGELKYELTSMYADLYRRARD